jgi:hypothetical protein
MVVGYVRDVEVEKQDISSDTVQVYIKLKNSILQVKRK